MNKLVIKYFFTLLVILLSGPAQLLANFSRIHSAENAKKGNTEITTNTRVAHVNTKQNSYKLHISLFEIEEDCSEIQELKSVLDTHSPATFFVALLAQKHQFYFTKYFSHNAFTKQNAYCTSFKALYIANRVIRI